MILNKMYKFINGMFGLVHNNDFLVSGLVHKSNLVYIRGCLHWCIAWFRDWVFRLVQNNIVVHSLKIVFLDVHNHSLPRVPCAPRIYLCQRLTQFAKILGKR
jgi:hypothetical protein